LACRARRLAWPGLARSPTGGLPLLLGLQQSADLDQVVGEHPLSAPDPGAADDAEVDQSDLVAALGEQSEAADAVLFGRVTFEEMRGYWPKQTDDTTGVSDYLNRVPKYVVSSTMGDPEWEHTTVLEGMGSRMRFGR
jgi:uncharacterized protein YozE (UPF0346 family)